MSTITELRLGARGSRLSMVQANYVRALCMAAYPGITVSLQVIQSLGDVLGDRPIDSIGAQGIFTSALEAALAEHRVDIAVHSAKDLPSSLGPAFQIAAVPPREDPRDGILTRQGSSFYDLPPGATVGTGSPRRVAQLQRLRPDLKYVPLRGNVDTRRQKVLDGRLDAAVLAMAGVTRLGLLDAHVVALSTDECLPQAGQGALAIEARVEDSRIIEAIQAIHDPISGARVEAERAVLAGLAAGCQAPVAAYAEVLTTGCLRVIGMVASRQGTELLTASSEGPLDEGARLGSNVAEQLREAGAANLLAEARDRA